MTYVLTATRFDQVVERFDNGQAKKVVRHRQGDIVDGLSEPEVARLLKAGAIAATGPAEEAPSDSSPRPRHTAPVAEWRKYAVTLGEFTASEAEELTKAELIEALS